MIWPASATRNSQGELSLGEITVTDLANQYGTPLYVFDEADVRKRARDYVAAFTVSDIETSVHYAGKAFLTTKVAQWVNQEGLGIDKYDVEGRVLLTEHEDFLLYNISSVSSAIADNSKTVGIFGINTVDGKATYTPPCSQGPGAKVYILT